MDKTNLRTRRNGNPVEKAKFMPEGEHGGGPVETGVAARANMSAVPGGAGRTAEKPASTVMTTAGLTPSGASDAKTAPTRGETGKGERPSGPRGLQDAFIDERNDVLAVINELEDQLDRQQEVREALERQLAATTEQLQAANQRTQELEWQTVTLTTRVDALEQLRHDVAALEEEVNDANGKAQRANEELANVEKERNRLKGELKAATKQVDELWAVRKERDGLRTDYKVLTARAEDLERTQRDLLSERSTLQAQIQEVQATLEQSNNGRNEAQIALRAAEDRIRELTQVQDALEDKLEAVRTEKKNLQVQLTHLERENARLLDQRQFYEAEVTTLRNQGRTAEAALASVKKAFSEVRVALTETRTRARRRAFEAWPRVGTPLHGLDDGAETDDAADALGSAGVVAQAEASAADVEMELRETEALVNQLGTTPAVAFPSPAADADEID